MSVWLQLSGIRSNAVLQCGAVCRHACPEQLSNSSNIAVSKPSMLQPDNIVLCVAAGLAVLSAEDLCCVVGLYGIGRTHCPG